MIVTNNIGKGKIHMISVLGVTRVILLLWYLTKYATKTGNITKVTLLTNVTRYLSNIVSVTSLILCNIITTSNEVTNLVSNPLSNA